MPKRFACVAKQHVEWQDYQDVPLQGAQVRVVTEYAAAKHGTEMGLYKGYIQARGVFDSEFQLFREPKEPRPAYPVGVGNMIVGPVLEVGPLVRELEVGNMVCTYGDFAETCTTKEGHCWKMPEGMSWKSAVCLDPAAFAMGAVRDGHVRVGDAVAVFGLGAIGLMVVQIAKLGGASPMIVVDPIGRRRQVAMDLGADLTLDPVTADVGLELKIATDRRGVDVAIEYSGTAAAMQAALRGVAYGGTVVAGASPPPYGAGLNLGQEAHVNIPRIVFSRACSQPDREYPRWDEGRIFSTCWRLLSERSITGQPIVQPVVPFGSLLSEYPKIATHPDDYIKLGVVV